MKRGVYFWPGANESLNPSGSMGHIALTHMHGGHMCATPIPHTQPHFWEATSDVSQPSEGAAEAECWGNLLQGKRRAAEQQQTTGLGRCVPWQVRMRPLLAWGGVRSLVGVFSATKWGWCESMTGCWKPQK